MTPCEFARGNHSAGQSLVSRAILKILMLSWFTLGVSGGAQTSLSAVLETAVTGSERSDSILGVVELHDFLCVQKHDSNSGCWKN